MTETGGKRIGFVDFQLDNFHANTYLKLIREPLRDRGFEVAGCTAMNEAAGRTWADVNQVPYCVSIKDLGRNVDFLAVLAPSNPEVHLDMCQAVLPLKKPTFVDKTFAPNLRTAKKIFELADKHKTPIMTSSALRHTNVQAHVKTIGGPGHVRHMVVFAPGRTFEEYVIHPLEMVVSCMGPTARQLMRRGTEQCSQILVNYSDGRTATINQYCQTRTPYAASVTTTEETQIITVNTNRLFLDAAAAILDFFAAGKPDFDRAETLQIMRMRDLAQKPAAWEGFVRV